MGHYSDEWRCDLAWRSPVVLQGGIFYRYSKRTSVERKGRLITTFIIGLLYVQGATDRLQGGKGAMLFKGEALRVVANVYHPTKRQGVERCTMKMFLGAGDHQHPSVFRDQVECRQQAVVIGMQVEDMAGRFKGDKHGSGLHGNSGARMDSKAEECMSEREGRVTGCIAGRQIGRQAGKQGTQAGVIGCVGYPLDMLVALA